MKKIFLPLLAVLLFSVNTFSQITFEKGYFIDNSNKKTECLIKNLGWLSNPTNFEYKLSDSSAAQIGTINDVKEFGIYNVTKFINRNVKIDRSPSSLYNLSTTREASLNTEKLFLKSLIEGKANLYSYIEKDLKRFFLQR